MSAALGVLVVLWLGAFLAAGSGIARGTTVLGVDIGGMSRAEAESTLDRELADEARAPIPVQVGDDTMRIAPRRVGLTLDVAATVDSAGERSWNPVALIDRIAGGEKTEPVVAVDEDRLVSGVEAFADKIEGKPRDGGIRFKGAEVVKVDAVQGRYLDKSAVVEKLRTSYLRAEGPIELPAEVTEPDVDDKEVARAAREFAEPAVSGPVVLLVNGRRTSVPPRLITPSLSMAPDDEGRLQPKVNAKVLKKRIAEVTGPLEQEPRDASFRIARGGPRVVPAKEGLSIKPEEVAAAVLPVLSKTGAGRETSVRLRVSQPDLTTREARGLGVKELVSEFTTFYPSDFPPRLTNIHRAADLMDETLLMPGDTFSLNGVVGERTKERGFAAGYVIDRGKLQVDFGGGVSQLATTTFNAAFFAGLEDVEHHPHSFYISRYPEGREATVAWGVKDLKFRNDSGHGILVDTAYTDGSVTVRIWGTKRYEIAASKSNRYAVRSFETVHDPRPQGSDPGDCVLQEGVSGFQVDVTRVFRDGGRQVKTERLHTVYQPEDRVVCGSNGPKKKADPPPDDD